MTAGAVTCSRAMIIHTGSQNATMKNSCVCIKKPEIHAAYDEKIYETLAEKGYATYDFFLPGLVIDAIENRRGTHLAAWAKEIVEKKISTVNMLGCHDVIPLLDLKGLLPKEEIERQF